VYYLSRLEEAEVVQSIKADFPDENLFSIQAVQPRFFWKREVFGCIPDNPEGRKSPEKKARKPKPPPRPIEEVQRSLELPGEENYSSR
jgi:hypothetical protein